MLRTLRHRLCVIFFAHFLYVDFLTSPSLFGIISINHTSTYLLETVLTFVEWILKHQLVSLKIEDRYFYTIGKKMNLKNANIFAGYKVLQVSSR